MPDSWSCCGDKQAGASLPPGARANLLLHMPPRLPACLPACLQKPSYAPGRVLVKLRSRPPAAPGTGGGDGVQAAASGSLPGLQLVQPLLASGGDGSGGSGASRRLAAAASGAPAVYNILDGSSVEQKLRQIRRLTGGWGPGHCSCHVARAD
jgi:hypothetical protein